MAMNQLLRYTPVKQLSRLLQVAKNIALAGVGWLTLMGNATCSQPEVASNFLLPADAPPNAKCARGFHLRCQCEAQLPGSCQH